MTVNVKIYRHFIGRDFMRKLLFAWKMHLNQYLTLLGMCNCQAATGEKLLHIFFP